LHWACDRGHLEIVLLLADHGADLNGLSEDGETPLHFACTSERLEIAKLLVERGADISIRDADGKTAFDNVDEDFRSQVIG